MTDLATPPDVEEKWREFNPHETTLAASLIATAQATLRVRVPGLDDRAAASADYAEMVKGLIVLAVLRVMQAQSRGNPSQVTEVYFSRAELAQLTDGTTEGSVTAPAGSFPDYCPLPVY